MNTEEIIKDFIQLSAEVKVLREELEDTIQYIKRLKREYDDTLIEIKMAVNQLAGKIIFKQNEVK